MYMVLVLLAALGSNGKLDGPPTLVTSKLRFDKIEDCKKEMKPMSERLFANLKTAMPKVKFKTVVDCVTEEQASGIAKKLGLSKPGDDSPKNKDDGSI